MICLPLIKSPSVIDIRTSSKLIINTTRHDLFFFLFPRRHILTRHDAMRCCHSTPAGVGWSSTPKNLLQDGDEFSVYVSHGVGTLINKIQEER